MSESVYTVMDILHILAAAVWFGANVARGLAGSRMVRADARTAAVWSRAVVWMGRVVSTPAAIVLFVTGFGLVGMSDGAFRMSHPFVVVGILVVVVGAVLGMAVIGPTGRRSAAAHEQGNDQLAAALDRRTALAGWIETALVAVAIALMSLSWGA